MPSDLVSVVIPTYNRAYCLIETVTSALAQTHQNVEVVIIDDGSSDKTDQLIGDTYAKEKRVRYVMQANTGVAGARNHGMRIATGDFVALLDSDDLWFPWKLELQVACMNAAPEIGMVWTDMQAVDADGVVRSERYLREMYSAYRWYPTPSALFPKSRPLRELVPTLDAPHRDERSFYVGDIFSQMVMGNLVHTSTVLIRRDRREKVGGFNESLRFAGEDFDYHLRTCREGPVGYADVSSIRYQCGRADQLTRPEYDVHMATNFLRTIEPVIMKDRARINLPDGMIDDVLAEAHAWVGTELLQNGEQISAIRHLSQSLRYRPYQPRTLGFLALATLPGRIVPRIRSVYRKIKARVV